MDTQLRILERQAMATGDWKRYALALQRIVAGQELDEKLYLWVVVAVPLIPPNQMVIGGIPGGPEQEAGLMLVPPKLI